MRAIDLPADLTGKTVLDLGGYDGEEAHRCLKAGAISATVVDNEEWRKYNWPGPTDEDHWQKIGVTYVQAEAMDWHEPADLVICSNVIYHVKDPFALLAHLRKLTRWKLLLRTSFHGGEGEPEGPLGWTWYHDGTGHENRTVWCRPSPGGLRISLRLAGFTDIREQGREGDHLTMECS